MFSWLHHLFNPHCPDCKLDEESKRVCPNCDVLRSLLEQERARNQFLVQHLLERDSPNRSIPAQIEEVKPIARHLSWPAKREQLEREAREEAERRRQELLKKQTKDLEKDLGIGDTNG